MAMDLSSLTNVLKLINPSINLRLLEGIRFADRMQLAEVIKVADTINIHVETAGQHNTNPRCIISAQERSSGQLRAALDLGTLESDDDLIAPYSTGIHIIIDNLDFWAKKSAIRWNRVAIIPAEYGKESLVSTLKSVGTNREFTLQPKSKGSLFMTFWQEQSHAHIELENNEAYFIEKSGSQWSIRQTDSSSYISCPDFPELIVSLDTDIVQSIVQITRQRADGTKEHYYYLIHKQTPDG